MTINATKNDMKRLREILAATPKKKLKTFLKTLARNERDPRVRGDVIITLPSVTISITLPACKKSVPTGAMIKLVRSVLVGRK